jgi:phosphatidyl-myo-inositol alpha-mannosyltransferase
MKDMRIGLVCPYSLSVPGGVQAQVLGMARELRRRGYEARVLGPCDGPPPAGFVTPLGDSLPTVANGSVAPLAPDPAAALRTIRVLYEERFDVLHLHEPLAPGPTVTALTMHPAPVVGTFHAAGDSSSYRLLRPALLRLISRIDHKVVVSKDALELVQRYLGGEYEVAFNGVELEAIAQVEPHPSPRPSILFLGRHEERKGLAVLLEALAEVPDDVECWVIGEGPDTAQLRSLHNRDHRIQWLGRVSEREKLSRLRGATVFCAPSLGGESFGVVLVEAMAAGTPVVASALDGYRNVATDGMNAVLLPPGDPQALGTALADLLADPPRQDHLRAAGLARAADFAMSALVDRYLEIYTELIAAEAAGAPSQSRANRIGRWLSRMR